MNRLQKLLRYRLLLAIWLIFICKGVFYTVLFPVWDGFDEFAHFAFIQHIALHHQLTIPDTRVSREVERSLELMPLPRPLVKILRTYTDHDSYWKLPVEERSAREAALLKIPSVEQLQRGETFLYEGKQGPLYYWLMAPVFNLVRDTTLPSRVLLFRTMNILLASFVIPIAFFTAREMFSTDAAAHGVCLLVSAMPELYIDASRVGNQALAMILFSVFTLLCWRSLEKDLKYLPAAGIALGLLLVTRAYGLAAIPALALVSLQAVRTAPAAARRRALMLCGVAFVCVVGIAAWWYQRNLQLVGAIIWFDVVPEQKRSMLELLKTIPKVKWSVTIDSLMGTHIWFGNWSSLSVRSWMYRVFEYGAVVAAAGLVILVVRSLRSSVSRDLVIGSTALFVCLSVYGMFLISTAYHALMNFINFSTPTSAGWYLYAVIVAEAVLVVAGLLAFRWGRQMLTGAVAFFFALEMYATHFLLIPYYSGLVSHTPNGGLRSFHVSQLRDIGVAELLARLEVNRPPFVTNLVLITMWCSFLIASAAVVYLAIKWAKDRSRL